MELELFLDYDFICSVLQISALSTQINGTVLSQMLVTWKLTSWKDVFELVNKF